MYLSVSIILLFLLLTQLFVSIYMIFIHKKSIGEDLGPEYGEKIDISSLVKDTEIKNRDNLVIVFLSIECGFCKEIIEQLKKDKKKYEDIIIVLVYDTNFDISTIDTEFSDTLMNYSELYYKYKINKFPYYIDLSKGKVKKKGFIKNREINRLVSEV